MTHKEADRDLHKIISVPLTQLGFIINQQSFMYCRSTISVSPVVVLTCTLQGQASTISTSFDPFG